MKKLWVKIVLLLATSVLAPLVVPLVAPWSGTNSRHQDINIKTGQARYSRRLWFIKISERIEDTSLSLALQGDTVDVTDTRPWRRVNTLSPGLNHSPHYRFHGALSQARMAEVIYAMYEFTPERKREVAVAVLTAWQESGGDRAAEEYLLGLLREPNAKVRGTGDGE